MFNLKWHQSIPSITSCIRHCSRKKRVFMKHNLEFSPNAHSHNPCFTCSNTTLGTCCPCLVSGTKACQESEGKGVGGGAVFQLGKDEVEVRNWLHMAYLHRPITTIFSTSRGHPAVQTVWGGGGDGGFRYRWFKGLDWESFK